MSANLRIDGDRLWASLMEQAAIGRTEKGGLRRLALSPEDGAVRDLFRAWCEEAGLTISVDGIGNIFATRPGTDPHAKMILMGSHLDTQIHGGRFDGILGVLGPLEVIRTLNERSIMTRHPLTIVNWTNEEGARFEPPMIGSKAFCGLHTYDEALAIRDKDGIRFGDALEAIGYRGHDTLTPEQCDSYFELHIEQGPELDESGIQVGIVSGAFDVRWAVIDIRGESAHSGTTRMADRRNAIVGAAAVIECVNEIGLAYASSGGRSTTARLTIEPNLLGILSHHVEALCDFRHPEKGVPQKMFESFQARLPELIGRTKCDIKIVKDWQYGAVDYDSGLASLSRAAADRLGYTHRDMLTVAGHDSMYIAGAIPATMIFTPCEKGISHNEAENVTLADIEPGTNVLLHAVLARDAQS